ncbi:MAG: hypothetical protein ACREQ9_03725, partial [Candidatus Binatia bacterium]
GYVFQDLFAYLLALAGYRSVRVNPVGVPDIEVSDLACDRPDPSRDRVYVALSRPELDRLTALARAAGDVALLARLEAEAGR